MSHTTITRSVRETVHSISIGREPMWGQDTLWRCNDLGLVDITGRLTPAGEAVARAEDERILASKRSSRIKRAARHEAMTSVGMKRTPYGGPHPNSVKKYVRHFLAELETRESVTADDGYTAEAFAAQELSKLGYPTERFLSKGHSAYGGPAVGNYTYNKPMIRIFRRPVTDGTVNAIA